jgi:hypothetical protein
MLLRKGKFTEEMVRYYAESAIMRSFNGQWKAARLNKLPKGAMVAVQVESNGEILVALVHSRTFRNTPDAIRPLFTGRVEKRLSALYRVLADFLIGAHAEKIAVRLLTRSALIRIPPSPFSLTPFARCGTMHGELKNPLAPFRIERAWRRRVFSSFHP